MAVLLNIRDRLGTERKGGRPRWPNRRLSPMEWAGPRKEGYVLPSHVPDRRFVEGATGFGTKDPPPKRESEKKTSPLQLDGRARAGGGVSGDR